MDITRRVMIDIETTGKTPGCNVLSIGATTFFDTEAPQGFYEKIKWDPLNPDFSDETDTMAWWRNQKQEVAHEAFSGTSYYIDVLRDLSHYIQMVRGKYCDFLIYANGAAFDFPTLEYAFKATGIAIPWQYYERQCYSTLKQHFPRVPKPRFNGDKHNALSDARNQAAHCEAILKFMS
jgi:DNA polymerase III epsilon subunit-like protein